MNIIVDNTVDVSDSDSEEYELTPDSKLLNVNHNEPARISDKDENQSVISAMINMHILNKW